MNSTCGLSHCSSPPSGESSRVWDLGGHSGTGLWGAAGVCAITEVPPRSHKASNMLYLERVMKSAEMGFRLSGLSCQERSSACPGRVVGRLGGAICTRCLWSLQGGTAAHSFQHQSHMRANSDNREGAMPRPAQPGACPSRVGVPGGP